jgi:hypothetical protein
MLARILVAVANLLLAALAWLSAMPLRGLPLVGVMVGGTLVLTLAVDLARRLRTVRPRRHGGNARSPS